MCISIGILFFPKLQTLTIPHETMPHETILTFVDSWMKIEVKLAGLQSSSASSSKLPR